MDASARAPGVRAKLHLHIIVYSLPCVSRVLSACRCLPRPASPSRSSTIMSLTPCHLPLYVIMRTTPQLVEPREPSLEVLGDVHTADYLHRIHHHNLTIVQASKRA